MLLQRIITITSIYVILFNGFINSSTTHNGTIIFTTVADQNDTTLELTTFSTVPTSNESDSSTVTSVTNHTADSDQENITTTFSVVTTSNVTISKDNVTISNVNVTIPTSSAGSASVDSTTDVPTNNISSNVTTKQPTVSPSTTKSTNKYASMTLEEKQKRNGITSAVICVGSLILIGISFLSSFIDKPSEKVPKVSINKPIKNDQYLNSNYRLDNEGQVIRDPNLGAKKKISFEETSRFVKAENSGVSNDIEMKNIKTEGTDKPSENQKKENTRKSGWDVLTKNPKFFDDYKPNRTNTSEQLEQL